MNINTKFSLGDKVYLKTDPDQRERMITEIVIQPINSIMYQLSLAELTTLHYEMEITEELNVKLKFSNGQV